MPITRVTSHGALYFSAVVPSRCAMHVTMYIHYARRVSMVSYQAEDLTRRNFLTLGGAVAATTLLPFDLKSAVADDVPKLGSSRR